VEPALHAQLRGFFAALPPRVLAVYVFGSEARGTAGAASDLDVALLFDSPPVPGLLGDALSIEGELERHIGRRVEIITLNTAPVDLVHRVFRDGVLVLDRDPRKRIRFEVAKRNEFFDLQPVLQEYRRAARPRSQAR
jgi:uncharacterized protein